MKRRNKPELEKPVSQAEVAKGAEEWQRLADTEMVTMLRQIRGNRETRNSSE